MFAHNCVDALYDAAKEFPKWNKTYTYTGKLISLIPKFDLGDMWPGESSNYMKTLTDALEADLLHLPYAVCYFEGVLPAQIEEDHIVDDGKMRVGLIVMEEEQDNKIPIFSASLFVQTKEGSKKVRIPSVLIQTTPNVANDGHKELEYMRYRGKWWPTGEELDMDNIDENLQQGVYSIIAILHIVLYNCLILNCKNVETEDRKPPEKLNKKRIKKGKTPLFTYKIIKIKTKRGVSSITKQGITHASPRFHYRRGHIRTYKNKKGHTGSKPYQRFIQTMAVGTPDLGYVHHDYKVEK